MGSRDVNINRPQAKADSCRDNNRSRFINVLVSNISDWCQFMCNLKTCGQLPRWVFRGQSNVDWFVSSSFDRMFPFYDTFPFKMISMSGFKPNKYYEAEAILTKFEQRGIDKFKNALKTQKQLNGWPALNVLAFMQHSGVPTRLIDFTYDPFSALYFAVNNDEEGKYAVWMSSWFGDDAGYDDLSSGKLEEAVKQQNEYNLQLANEFLECPLQSLRVSKFQKVQFVFVQSNGKDNENQKAQKGLFFMPFSLLSPSHDMNKKAFDLSLLHMLKGYEDKDKSHTIELLELLKKVEPKDLHRHVKGVKFIFSDETRPDALKTLYNKGPFQRLPSMMFPGRDSITNNADDVAMLYRYEAQRINRHIQFLKASGQYYCL